MDTVEIHCNEFEPGSLLRLALQPALEFFSTLLTLLQGFLELPASINSAAASAITLFSRRIVPALSTIAAATLNIAVDILLGIMYGLAFLILPPIIYGLLSGLIAYSLLGKLDRALGADNHLYYDDHKRRALATLIFLMATFVNLAAITAFLPFEEGGGPEWHGMPSSLWTYDYRMHSLSVCVVQVVVFATLATLIGAVGLL